MLYLLSSSVGQICPRSPVPLVVVAAALDPPNSREKVFVIPEEKEVEVEFEKEESEEAEIVVLVVAEGDGAEWEEEEEEVGCGVGVGVGARSEECSIVSSTSATMTPHLADKAFPNSVTTSKW